MLGDLAGVVAEELHRLGDVAQGLEPALADLEGHRRRQVEGPSFHHLGGRQHDVATLLPGGRPPLALEGAGGGHGVVHVPGGGLGVATDEDVVVDGRSLFEPLPGDALFSRHHQRMVLAQVPQHPLHGGVVGRLQILVVGGHGGVGDLEGHRSSSFSSARSTVTKAGGLSGGVG